MTDHAPKHFDDAMDRYDPSEAEPYLVVTEDLGLARAWLEDMNAPYTAADLVALAGLFQKEREFFDLRKSRGAFQKVLGA